MQFINDKNLVDEAKIRKELMTGKRITGGSVIRCSLLLIYAFAQKLINQRNGVKDGADIDALRNACHTLLRGCIESMEESLVEIEDEVKRNHIHSTDMNIRAELRSIGIVDYESTGEITEVAAVQAKAEKIRGGLLFDFKAKHLTSMITGFRLLLLIIDV